MNKNIMLGLCALLLVGCASPAAAPVVQLVTVLAPATVEVTRLVQVTQLVEVTRVVAPTARPATATLPATVGPTAAPTSAGPVGVSTPQQAGNIIFTILTLKGVKSVDQFTVAKPGNVIIICDVLIQNLGPDSVSYNPFYFKVKDGDGFEYSSNFSAPDPTMRSGDLAAGDKVRGNVAFEIPATAKAVILSYDSSIVGVNLVQVNLGDAPAPQ